MVYVADHSIWSALREKVYKIADVDELETCLIDE